MSEFKLPAVLSETTTFLDVLTDKIGVSRNILASNQEIKAAWDNLPRVLTKIQPELIREDLARMCVAVAAGLFDSAINYIWNATIVELKSRVTRFGLNVVRQFISDHEFDEKALLELRDADLLSLCLKLSLITEEGFFLLDQCRDIRNYFSAAHPSIGKIDDHEFIGFVNRCAKHVLGSEVVPIGVDIPGLISALKGEKFSTNQLAAWTDRLQKTHQVQRDSLLSMLHGIFSDPSSSEETRLNALAITGEFLNSLTPKVKSGLIDQHQDYIAKGDKERQKASQQFFEKMGLLSLLNESEQHALISNACKRLIEVHDAFDNFYNEPPFAERLANLVEQIALPDTVREEFVETVVTCAVGNAYGTSHAAFSHYKRMIKGFSPAEVAHMLSLPDTKTLVGQRIRSHARCKAEYSVIVKLLDPVSVPTKVKSVYSEWLK